MSEQDIKDCNFLVIAAVEGYAQKHGLMVADVIKLFNQHDIISLFVLNTLYYICLT